MIVGIDSGFKGGIAILKDDGTLDKIIKMPIMKSDVGYELNYKAIYAILECTDIIFLEKAQSMPGNGAKQAMKYGGQYYALKCIIKLLNKPLHLVNVQRWKNKMLEGMNKSDKNASIIKAKMLCPFLSELKINDGQAEAYLIAYYGYGLNLHRR